METTLVENKVELGDRKLQFGSGAYVLNVPKIAVRLFKLEAGDVMRWHLVGEVLSIQRIAKKTPDTQPEPQIAK